MFFSFVQEIKKTFPFDSDFSLSKIVETENVSFFSHKVMVTKEVCFGGQEKL